MRPTVGFVNFVRTLPVRGTHPTPSNEHILIRPATYSGFGGCHVRMIGPQGGESFVFSGRFTIVGVDMPWTPRLI